MPPWKRIADPVQGAVGRLRPKQDDEAFVKAAREAYRAAATDPFVPVENLAIAETFAPATAAGPSDPPVPEQPTMQELERRHPVSKPPGVEPATEPADVTPSARSTVDLGFDPVSPTLGTRGAAPPEASTTPNSERPARRGRPGPGETAPGHLLRATESVKATTDGFLDALMRRNEGHR
jgi:hypothetical protein